MMALFGFGKKKEKAENTPACACSADAPVYEAEPACCCGEEAKQETSCCCGGEASPDCCKSITSMKVLGTGCKSCHAQYENAKQAVADMGLNIEVEYVTNMEQIVAYGVMSMPALVVNEKVAAYGKVLKSADIIKLMGKLGY